MKQKKRITIISVIVGIIVLMCAAYLIFNATRADVVYYGNIVTMDESNPNAEAVAVKGGKISYVGTKDGVKDQIGAFTQIKDYEDDYIYPGFIDGHAHMGLFAPLSVNGCTLDRTKPLKENCETMKQFITDNPGQDVYKGIGWWGYDDDPDKPTHETVDKFTSNDVPVVLVDAEGHRALLNQKAIEYYDLKNKVSVYGTDAVQVDSKGDPTGFVSETPRFDIEDSFTVSKEDLKKFIISKQEMYLKQGYTTIMDAGLLETDNLPMISAFRELAEEGKLKLKLRSYVKISETENDKLEKVDQIVKWAKEINYENFKIVGIKIFLDGVPEALTSWTSSNYVDTSKGANYQGYKRWTDSTKSELTEIIKKANENGLMVHFHAMGEGAISYAMDCFEAAREGATDFDYRNGLAHLSYVNDGDFQRFLDNKVSAFVAPHWCSYKSGTMENEIRIYGEEKSLEMYKIKTFIDKGITTSFHTDGMRAGGAPEMIYSAATRLRPGAASYGDGVRGLEECIGGMDSLKCLTISAAYTIKEENNLGCIKVGYSADFTIYNKDFTKDENIKDEDILKAILLAIVSNGQPVYSSDDR